MCGWQPTAPFLSLFTKFCVEICREELQLDYLINTIEQWRSWYRAWFGSRDFGQKHKKQMIETTQRKGTLTELHCIMDLTEMGVRTLTPTDEASKYDVVADLDGKFIRIQCKTSTWCTDTKEPETAFYINTYCMTTNTKETTKHLYTKSDIDYFYTYFQGQGYLVSIEEASGKTFRWRYEYPSTGQRQGVHIAKCYKIEEVVRSLIV